MEEDFLCRTFCQLNCVPEVFVVVVLRLEVLVVVVVVDALRAEVADDGLVQRDAPPVVPLQLLGREPLPARRARRRRLHGPVALAREVAGQANGGQLKDKTKGLHSGRKKLVKCQKNGMNCSPLVGAKETRKVTVKLHEAKILRKFDN